MAGVEHQRNVCLFGTAVCQRFQWHPRAYLIMVSGAGIVSTALPDFSMPGIRNRVYPGPGIRDFMAYFHWSWIFEKSSRVCRVPGIPGFGPGIGYPKANGYGPGTGTVKTGTGGYGYAKSHTRTTLACYRFRKQFLLNI